MALTTDQKIAALEDEWETLQSLLSGQATAAQTSAFDKAGSLPIANGSPLNIDHREFHERWRNRQKEIEQQIQDLRANAIGEVETYGIV